MMMQRRFLMVFLLIILFLVIACLTPGKQPPQEYFPPTFSSTPSLTATPSPTFTPTLTKTPSPTPTQTASPTPVVLLGAGDISICGQNGDEQTAALLEINPGAGIFTAGDNSNEDGSNIQYQNCFLPSWGQYLDRLHPSPGNHDLKNGDANGYYAFFGSSAGDPGKGYYSYDLGEWHIISLNSNCEWVACGPNSKQVEWLRVDLEAHPALCTLAYWHHPRWDSGFAGNDGRLAPIWRTLYEYGVDVVVNGHEHHYERFAPQDPDSKPDPARGIRQFIVGTGGAYLIGFGVPQPNSEVRDSSTFGVIKFTLGSTGYTWEFLPSAGGKFSDSGADVCH